MIMRKFEFKIKTSVWVSFLKQQFNYIIVKKTCKKKDKVQIQLIVVQIQVRDVLVNYAKDFPCKLRELLMMTKSKLEKIQEKESILICKKFTV